MRGDQAGRTLDALDRVANADLRLVIGAARDALAAYRKDFDAPAPQSWPNHTLHRHPQPMIAAMQAEARQSRRLAGARRRSDQFAGP